MPIERGRPWRILTFATLGLAAFWQLFVALRMSPKWIGAVCTVDDTFLALEVGRRWAASGFPTFDGIHRTSGFQPLWGLLLAAIAHFFNDPIALLRATLVLAAVANTCSGILIAHLAPRLMFQEPRLTCAAVACWSAYCITGRPALIGLENCLLPLALLGAIFSLIALAGQHRSLPGWLALGTCCVALVWIRLDAAILVLFLSLAAALITRPSRPRAGPIAALLALACGGGAYLAFELWSGGELSPISGLAKRALASQRVADDIGLIQPIRAIFDAGNIVLKNAMSGIGCATPRALSSAGRIALLVIIIAALGRIALQRTRWVYFALGALLAHALLIRTWLGQYFHDTPWYYSAISVLAAIGVPLLILIVLGAKNTTHPASAVACAGLGVFAIRFAYSSWMLSQPVPSDNLSVVRQTAGAWLASQLPPDTRIAAWNAGELAFFSGRTLINLDGLMNDRDFLSRYVRGAEPIAEYLEEQRVDWVIDYASAAYESPNCYWNALPSADWEEITQFGHAAATAQLLVHRRRPSPNPADRTGEPGARP